MLQLTHNMMELSKLLANFGQFFFGLFTLLLALYAVIVKRKEIFRTELHKKQIEELAMIREKLFEVFFDIYYIPMTAETMLTLKWNIDDLKENDIDSWEQYQRFKKNCLELFYKFRDRDYYLFHKWIDTDRTYSFGERMVPFAPFTLSSVRGVETEKRKEFTNEILKLITYFDHTLKKMLT